MSYRDEIRLEAKKLVTRRYFFKECGIGLGSLALADLLKENLFGARCRERTFRPPVLWLRKNRTFRPGRSG